MDKPKRRQVNTTILIKCMQTNCILKRVPIRSQQEHARIFDSLPRSRTHSRTAERPGQCTRGVHRTQPQLTFTLATPFSAISTPRRNQFGGWMTFMRRPHVIARLGGGVVITADRPVAGAPIGRIIVLIHDGGVRPLCVVAVRVCVAFVADARRGQPIVNHSDVARLLRALAGALLPRRSLALAQLAEQLVFQHLQALFYPGWHSGSVCHLGTAERTGARARQRFRVARSIARGLFDRYYIDYMGAERERDLCEFAWRVNSVGKCARSANARFKCASCAEASKRLTIYIFGFFRGESGRTGKKTRRIRCALFIVVMLMPKHCTFVSVRHSDNSAGLSQSGRKPQKTVFAFFVK